MHAKLQPYLDRWNLTPLDTPFETRSSFLLPVTQAGRAAFLKVAKPESNERPGMALLSWWQGRGAVEVLAQDEEACLTLAASPTPSLKNLADFDDDTANAILIDRAHRLHGLGDTPPPQGLVPLTKVVEYVLSLPSSNAPVYAKWRAFAERLDVMGKRPVPLHGDVHHDNVLWVEESQSWAVIDPKGEFGHAAYDFANLFFNPIEQPERVGDEARMEGLARMIVERTDLSLGEVLDFAYLYGGLSSQWGLPEGLQSPRDRQFALIEGLHGRLGDG